MASKLTSLQLQLSELEAKALALANDESSTRAQADELRAQIVEVKEEIASQQALLSVAAQAAPSASVRQPLSANPRSDQDPRRGFQSIGEYAIAARNYQASMTGRPHAPVDPRVLSVAAETQRFRAEEQAELQRYAADHGYSAAAPSPLHQEGHSEDGLLVPPDFRREIWTPAYESDDLLQLFNPQTTSSRVVQFAADETTPWGAAGIKAYWTAEGAQKTPSKLTLSPREVHLHKIAALVYSTDELLQDAPLLTSRINEAAPRAIGWEVSEALIRGNGVGKPLGFEAAAYPGRVTIAKETNQKAGTILTENVLNMAARVIEGPGSRLLWLAHRSTIPQIATLRIGNEPSWTNQNQGLREAPSGMLLGAPIRFTQHAKSVGTVGDLTLVDLSGYAAFVHSSGTRFDSSIHLYFDYDITAFRWVFRVGGMPYLSTPVTPADGAATMSHFVQLATRA